MINPFDRAVKITQEELQAKYEHKDMIDAGSYGIVYKYFDKVTKEYVAMKMLKDYDGLEGFEKEEEIMNQINHENVLKCLGFYYNTTKLQYFLVTPYCQKNNLKTCLPEIKQFDQKRKIWLCVQIARGINALHELNIMHRDVKPANILVTKDWQLKLCDFGFGKLDQSLKQTAKVGTAIYRDPNVNFGKYSKKCDIYSVGLVYDTIFRGQSVFQKASEALFQQDLQNFKLKKKQIISKLKCSDQIKEIILGCLQSDETKRTSSKSLLSKMEDLWAALNPKQQDIQYERMIQKQKNEMNQRKLAMMTEKKQVQNKKLLQKNTIKIEQAQYNYVSQYQPAIPTIPSSPKMLKKFTGSPLKSRSSISLSQSTNDPNFLTRMLSSRQVICHNIDKNSNFQTIYRYFVNRKAQIRELDELSKIKSLIASNKKIVIFIAMFGYLRFLKINKYYLKQEKSYIKDIQGVKFQDISQKTIEICLNLIQKQIILILTKIKPFLADLDADRRFYQDLLTKNVIAMIDYGINKKFLEIEEYRQETIVSEYEDFLMHSRFYIDDQEQIALKEKLLQIKNIF